MKCPVTTKCDLLVVVTVVPLKVLAALPVAVEDGKKGVGNEGKEKERKHLREEEGIETKSQKRRK